MTAHILTQERLKELLNYNPDTGIFTWRSCCGGRSSEGKIAGSNQHGYIRINLDKQKHYAHRLAWLYMRGDVTGTIDHINHDKADNRIDNLRIATHIENNRNRAFSSKNTSGHVGVYFVKRLNRWNASIKVNCKLIHLGYFDCLTAAAVARQAANLKYGFHENHGK